MVKNIKITNSEGIVIFKLKLKIGYHQISVSYTGDSNSGDSSASKIIKCIKGNVKTL